MKLSITLLGQFEVRDADTKKVLAVRTYSRLYALLAVNLGKPLARTQLLECLYPEVEPKVSTNRLRVVLSGMRKMLGPALQEHDQEIWFRRDFVQVDLLEVTEALGQLEDEVDPLAELACLKGLLPKLGLALLPGFEEDWIAEIRDEWTTRAMTALARTRELALAADEFELVCDAAQTAFLHEPFDEGHWRAFLRSKVRLGDASGAVRAFHGARRKLDELHLADFSPELLELAEDVRTGRVFSKPDSLKSDNPTERDFLWMAIEWLLERDIEPLQGLIKSKVFREVQTFAPRPSLDFIERVLAKSVERTPLWLWARYAQIRSYAGYNHAQAVIDIWEDVKDEEMEPDLRTGFLICASFSHFQKRDYELAQEMNEECIAIQKATGNEAQVQMLQVNKGSYLWHLGKYEEAHSLYDIAELPYHGKTTAYDRVSLATVQINRAFLETMRGDNVRAYGHIQAAERTLEGIKADSVEPMMRPMQGFLWVVNGEPAGYQLVIEGLKLGYRVKHERSQQIAVDYAAGLMAHAGCGQSAAALLAYAEKWREETQHQFSVAERELTERFLAMSGNVPWTQPFPANPTPRQALNWVVVELRALHRRAVRAETA